LILLPELGSKLRRFDKGKVADVEGAFTSRARRSTAPMEKPKKEHLSKRESNEEAKQGHP
jgi:hypothetical protein